MLAPCAATADKWKNYRMYRWGGRSSWYQRLFVPLQQLVHEAVDPK